MTKKDLKSPIFIVGPHRSGSTLWNNLLAMSPGVLRLTDMRFLSYWWQKDVAYFIKGVGDLRDDKNVDKMVQQMFGNLIPKPKGLEAAFWRFENHSFVFDRAFQETVSNDIKQSDRSLGAIFRAILDQLTLAAGLERACVKFPVDVANISSLVQWYPDCRILNITRDPRAMAMSRQNDPEGTAIKIKEHPRLAFFIRRAMLFLVVEQYRTTAKCHQLFKSLPNYRLFQYEDLLANPEGVLRDVCQFAGCEYVPEMLHPEQGVHKHQRSTHTGKQRDAFDMTAAGRWAEVMSPIDRWWISASTRQSMRLLGYSPETHPVFAKRQISQPSVR